MIAEIAAFNLACATLKEAANHTGDIVNLFGKIGEAMSAKSKVDEAVKDSKQSGKSDLELYAQHVQMEQQWEEVKEILKWTGHWDKYLKFCADRREEEKQRKIAEKRAELARKQKLRDGLIVVLVVVGFFMVIGSAGAMLYWLIGMKGK